MKLKLDDAGHVVVSDGKPVYIDDDGKDIAVDYPATVTTINRLNSEAKAHRVAKETAEEKLKSFVGIDDPKAALEALKTVANLDAKKLVDAGQIETVKQETIKSVEHRFKPVEEERDALRIQLNEMIIGGSFASSKFIADKIAVPGDMLRARFDKNFEVKDGKLVAKDASGNPIYSRARAGEFADFDEAIELLVEQYPQKDSILKANNAAGDGKRQSSGGGGSGKTMKRAEFDAKSAKDRAAIMADGTVLVD